MIIRPLLRLILFICIDAILQCALEDGPSVSYTDKKENKIFLIFKEIRNGAVAKSYMRKGYLIYEEIRKYLVIYEEAVYDFATAPFRMTLYMRKI
jgi:hypothetical protein